MRCVQVLPLESRTPSIKVGYNSEFHSFSTMVYVSYIPFSSYGTNIPWFNGIFNAFSLSLVCVQKPLCIDFYATISLFAGNLSKDKRGSF